MSRTLAVAALAAASALAAPAAAGAAAVIYDPTANTYTYFDDSAGQNEANAVTVRQVGTKLVIADTVAQRSGTNRCVVVGGTLECAAGTASLSLRLAGGSDRLDYRAPQAAFVDAGPDSDYVTAGHREGSLPRGVVTLAGGDGFDWISWFDAPSATSVTADDNVLDGIANENLLVHGFEGFHGTAFADRLWGSARADVFLGGNGDDSLAGGDGGDLFVTVDGDGADDHHGGPGVDGINYAPRSATPGVNVSLDNVANDGAPFERDNVRGNVENVTGTPGPDKLFSFSAFSTLDGLGGDDRLEGGDGPDQLIGGAGRDTLLAGLGADTVAAADREPDTIDCEQGSDVVTRDQLETKVQRCESDLVGVLRLERRALSADAGEAVPVGLSWRHPLRWKLLKSVAVHVSENGARLGTVTIDLRSGRAAASGAVGLASRGIALKRDGKLISATLPLRFEESVQGRRLQLAVEAVERSGRRQVVERAATVEVR
ncbi:calcium-binding protein [Conexibacter stalactiti]|uniref:Calcium-binding protein n=1 Tax=Conexibacter stalactiti TaxID=1940611 RepID=A0ABU4HVC7_9ACTN|nr:calcium-binding protein [Conexibacter stalactiti]MDW5597221.1 calcium-binding protein [Conexibacter stalactiti]MEC5037863.1 calcium-binding protein [Conexibacter stalactiti]